MALGSTPGLIVAAGVGAAASVALEPAFEVPKQEAWARNANKVLDTGTLARLVARGGVILGKPGDKDGSGAYAEALRQGYSADKLDRLVYLSQTFPGSGELDALSNRGLVTVAQVREALTRAGLPPEWHQPIIDRFADILSPGELAAAIHRGLVPDPGILLGEQPSGLRKVDSYPVQPIDPVKEAAGSGYNKERLAVLVGLQGLPMGTHEAAEAFFRGVITHGDYIAAFNESNSRNEWAPAVLEYSRQIPTARDYLENALRGYSNLADAIKGAARHGMTSDDATLIYQNQGRPMNIHQITQALARGAKFNPEPGELKDPYKASIVEGPIKPAYYEMAESLKFTLPSVFTMRALAQSGVWDEAKTAERLKWAGWFPQDADEAAAAWAAGSGAASPDAQREKLAVTQAIAALKKQFLIEQADGQTVIAGLELLGVSAASAGRILETWTIERGWTDKPLTPSQIKKAYSANTYTLDVAVAKLEAQHFTEEAANTYLTT